MAVNQKLENTSNSCSRSSHGLSTGWSAWYCAPLDSLRLRWGSSAPGTAPSASRNSRTSAVPIEVSARQGRRALPTSSRLGSVLAVTVCVLTAGA